LNYYFKPLLLIRSLKIEPEGSIDQWSQIPITLKEEMNPDSDPDPHLSEKLDPDPNKSDVFPQLWGKC
jgi:hypothetical protein